MDTNAIEAEVLRISGMIQARGWARSYVEISCISGPYPWRVILGRFAHMPTLIQGADLPDAIEKTRRWVETAA